MMGMISECVCLWVKLPIALNVAGCDTRDDDGSGVAGSKSGNVESDKES